MINKVLNNRYEILELIGRGGMAYVYKAKDLKLNRNVAVKVLREEYTENEQFIKKFDRESQAAAGLTHPNIVSVYDVGVEGDIYYIIMEYVDGITLKQYLSKKGHLDYKEAINFIIDIATALNCAHENKIIHRDIKPHNIMLTKDMTPKVGDFGIARAITSSTVTLTNQTMGSVHYISPEQARGGFVDERSDLYSLGIVFYELITGELPFDEESTVTIAIKHIQDEITPPKQLRPEIPDSVNDVILKLTRKKSEDRYQNMLELIADLKKIQEDVNTIVTTLPLVQENDDDQLVGTGASIMDPSKQLFDSSDNENGSGLDEDLIDIKKRRRRNRISGVLAFILILGLGSYIYFSGIFSRAILVPDITNLTVEEATAQLEKLGLKLEVEKEAFSSEVEEGKIITQNPQKNMESKPGKIIKVTISKGIKNVSIPDIQGLTKAEAIRKLESTNLVIGEIKSEYNNEVSPDIVYGIYPAVGTSVPEGTKVNLFVSRGKDLVEVPRIIGLSEEDARAKISSNGLSVGTVTTAESEFYQKGVVISQFPVEGTEIERKTAINFVVSSGPAKPKPITPNTPPAPTPTPTDPTD